MSPLIRFGTSTWAYEGWQGLLYRKAYPKGRFKKDCLTEYTQYEYNGQPLFRTAGLDAIYTRLRNELAHTRLGVDLHNTKAEMATRLGGLIALTKRAIELHH